MNYFIPTAKISRDQGQVFRLGRLFIVPMFHPAAALRSTQNLEALEASFKKLPAIIKKVEALGVAENIQKTPILAENKASIPPQEGLF